MSDVNDMIEIQSVTSPGQTQRVNRAKYLAMRDALIAVLPEGPPGVTVAEARAAVVQHLPKDLFPGGEKAGWWFKAVQLDLEAKRAIARGAASPVRLFKLPQ